MNEPSVDFQFPAEHGDDEIIEAREQGRVQGERLAWLILAFVTGAKNPKLRLAAFQYIANPDAKSMRQIAAELKSNPMAVHREVVKVRSFKLPRDVVTACLG